MAKHETLGSLFTDIADQLRAKGCGGGPLSWAVGNAHSGNKSVCYGDGKFVGVASSRAVCSTDGISWKVGATISGTYLLSVCYGNGKFVAVGNGLDGNGCAVYSEDGMNWIRTTIPIGYWVDVCYGNGIFVAVADGYDIAAYSTDGINWTEAEMPEASRWSSVCYGNGVFIAYSEQNYTSAYSYDGISWTEGSSAFLTEDPVSCYGDGKFVAVGFILASVEGSYVKKMASAISEDGISFEYHFLPYDSMWRDISYGNGLFVAVDSADYFCSSDGINWTKSAWPLSGTPNSLCYGDGKFVFVGNGISGYGVKGLVADNFPETIAELSPFNIAYGAAPPADTSKLWVPLATKPSNVEVSMDSLPSAVDALATKAAVLSVAVRDAVAAEVDGKIYIFGGTPTAGATLIQEYNPATDTIITKTAVLPANTYGAAAVAIKGKIYIFGGVSYKTTIYEYDPATDTITQKSALEDGVSYPAAVAINDKAYIFGGQITSSGYTNWIQEYDPETDTCVQKEALLESTTYGVSVVAINDKAYIFGGRSYATTIQEYDPATDKIATKDCELLDGMMFASTAAINGKAYIIGGQISASAYTSWIQEYDPTTNTIVQKDAVLSVGMGRMATAVVDGKVYLIGGYDDDNTYDTIQEYTVKASLAENHLKLFATGAAGTGEKIAILVNWPGSSLKMQVFAVYVGDADGYAVMQEAYIYDTASAVWKSLSGSVYTG